jgi:transcriptional regulator with XRE-family HTH domain
MSSIIVTYVRKERRSAGLTQQELAQLLGLSSRTHVSALEHGIRIPTAQQVLAAQLIFGKTALQLFPYLSVDVVDRVAEVANTLLKDMEQNPSPRAQRKTTLLRQILSRAVIS